MISQQHKDGAEFHVVKIGRKMFLARKVDDAWKRVASGEEIAGQPRVAGHVMGIVWARV